eukprot:g82554.t1
MITQKKAEFATADKTPSSRSVPAGGFVHRSLVNQKELVSPNSTVHKIVVQRDKYEFHNDQQARDRERVGRATDLHYREMSREFLERLGLPECSDWRDLQDEKIRIPASLGRGFVDTLMEGRGASQYDRGRDTWTSADSANAMDAINPVTQEADWKVARSIPAAKRHPKAAVEPSTPETKNTSATAERASSSSSSSPPAPGPLVQKLCTHLVCSNELPPPPPFADDLYQPKIVKICASSSSQNTVSIPVVFE